MQRLNVALDQNINPLYLRIASAVRLNIQAGGLRTEEALPSARNLAKELGCNRHTVMAAYQELIAQGWLESIERHSYRVASHLPIEHSKFAAKYRKQKNKGFVWRSNHSLLNESQPVKKAHQYRYNFAGGSPGVSLFPHQEFKGYVRDAFSKVEPNDAHYGQGQGNEAFLIQAQTYLRRVRGITDKEIITVNGSQEALYIIARLFIKPGDNVLVESLGYQPAWEAFRLAGANLIGVHQLESGIDIAHLQTLLTQHSFKLIYLTPLHQYPTTATLPIQHRSAIYALAAEHNIIVVEDDYDHEFHYDSQPLAPMAASDPLGLVIYLSTFSKIFYPGCRVGMMAVDKAIAPSVLAYRKILNHKPNPMLQRAIADWMRSGGFERHLRRMSKTYQQRRDHMLKLITERQQRGIELNCKQPAGGMALWLDIKSRACEFEQYCQQKDIYLMAEEHFHLNPEHSQNRFVRMGFAGIAPELQSQAFALMDAFWC